MREPNSLRPHQAALVLACVISVALWFLPFLRWVTVPLQYLNTHIHEAWHALSAVATDGLVSHIQVHANGNGETYTAGGNNLVISSMGYVGASLTGALIIFFSQSPKMARSALIVLSGALAYSLLVWVRNDLFGIVSAIAWIAAIWAIAYVLDERKRVFAAQFLGVQQCLNSVQSLFFLVQISGFGVKQSDAGNMERFTHIPAILWSVIWCAISFGLMFFAFKFSWNSRLDSSISAQESAH